MQQSDQLSILGAVYGKKDVTDMIRGLVQNGSVQIRAVNEFFGDSFPNVVKTLVIVYQYGTKKPVVSITKEGEMATISQNSDIQEGFMTSQPGQTKILGAAYGLGVVTDRVSQMVENNNLEISASNAIFGDPWHGVRKVLTVVYKDSNGSIRTTISEEGGKIKIGQDHQQNSQQVPKIFGAAYGKADVTDKVRSLVSKRKLHFQVENHVFGDSWHGVLKSLVVVYQLGDAKPRVGIVREHQTFSFSEDNQPSEWATMDLGQIQILGAAYGLADVTNQVASKIQNSVLQVQADNQSFGDSWYGTRKTLVIVYRDAQGNIKTSIAEEGSPLRISAQPPQIPKILGAAYGKTNITDKVRSMIAKGNLEIPAENRIFGDSFPGVVKSLVVVYQFGDDKPRVGIIREHQTLTLSEGDQNSQSWNSEQPVRILGAAYGLVDVTNKIASRIKNSVLEVHADNESLGDSWYGTRKTLVVVSQDPQGNVNTHIVEEEGHLRISFQQSLGANLQQIPTILGAVYGRANVSEQVRSKVANGCLQIKASNNVFGDSFPNVKKTLVVVYQFGNAPPQVGIAKENETLALINQIHPAYQWFNPLVGQPCILGAVYGLENVTHKLISRIQNSILEVRADNESFGDSWYGTRKTLVVVYQDPQGNVNTYIIEEEGTLKISFPQPQQLLSGNFNNNYQQQPYYGGNFHPQQQFGGGYQPQYGGNFPPQFNYGQPYNGNNFQPPQYNGYGDYAKQI